MKLACLAILCGEALMGPGVLAFSPKAGVSTTQDCVMRQEFRTKEPNLFGVIQPSSTSLAISKLPNNDVFREKGKKVANAVWNRMENTMADAGFDNALVQGNPLKNPIVLIFLVVVGKYLRAKYILKGQSKMNEFQPAWGHVITSKEQEKDLHAYTCKNCGTTIFIAKGREFRFFNQFVQCLNCGVMGKNNFVDTRDEIVAVADDDEFVYESPVNYRLSKRERKKLEQQEAEAKARKEEEEAEAAGEKETATAVMEKEEEEQEDQSSNLEEEAEEQVVVEAASEAVTETKEEVETVQEQEEEEEEVEIPTAEAMDAPETEEVVEEEQVEEEIVVVEEKQEEVADAVMIKKEEAEATSSIPAQTKPIQDAVVVEKVKEKPPAPKPSSDLDILDMD